MRCPQLLEREIGNGRAAGGGVTPEVQGKHGAGLEVTLQPACVPGEFFRTSERFQIAGDNILLGKPFIFNKGNIDQFNF